MEIRTSQKLKVVDFLLNQKNELESHIVGRENKVRCGKWDVIKLKRRIKLEVGCYQVGRENKVGCHQVEKENKVGSGMLSR